MFHKILMSSNSNRINRFEVRVSADEKRTVEYAATLEGTTVSAYMRSRILKAAQEDISSQEKLLLSNRDRDLFLNALENQTEPSERLKTAFLDFKRKYQPS
jgi:uncharacterized protein (DUF1778 family)